MGAGAAIVGSSCARGSVSRRFSGAFSTAGSIHFVAVAVAVSFRFVSFHPFLSLYLFLLFFLIFFNKFLLVAGSGSGRSVAFYRSLLSKLTQVFSTAVPFIEAV